MGFMDFYNRDSGANSMDQRKALGRGLTSLIPSSAKSDGGKKFLELPVTDILTNPNQPRKLFSKEAIDELAHSIEEKGIIQPLIVRPIGGGKYEIVAGERRFRAAKQLGLESVPAVVRDISSNETLELALIENIQRENLNVIEEALAYKDLLSKFQYTQDELAKRLGKDRSSIANSLRLLKLPDKIRNYLIGNELSMGHARALLAIDDKDVQSQIADDIIANALSVRDTENLIKKMKGQAAAETAPQEPHHGKTAAAKALPDSSLTALETCLKEKLKTYVKISGNAKKGRFIISYQNEGELNDISQKLMG